MCSTDLNEDSYLGAKFWREGLWKAALRDGAMQSAATLLSGVKTAPSLQGVLDDLPRGPGIRRIALECDSRVSPPAPRGADISEAGGAGVSGDEAVLAVGPERGWSHRERGILAEHGFTPVRLGERILRTETACAAGAGLMLLQLGIY